MWADRYLGLLADRFAEMRTKESGSLARAAQAMTEAIARGGLVYVFGCGHSAALAMDIFYRAGGLAVVHPIFAEEVLLNRRPVTETSQREREEGWAPKLLAESGAGPGDVMLVISTSGRNGAPVDMAIAAKSAGLVVIGLTSRAYAESLSPRHSSGKRLHEVADIVIDNHAAPGDAEIALPGLQQRVGPTSTTVGAALLQALVVETVAGLLARDHKPPVFMSANVPGGDEHNAQVLAQYRDRIRFF